MKQYVVTGMSCAACQARVEKAVSAVPGVTACSVVILGISQDTGQGVTYADIANSLSTDYIYLYYVNLNTESFIEYSPDPSSKSLTAERHGTDFFAASRKDAMEFIYSEDAERFAAAFHKENVVRALDEYGTFTFTYRLLVDGTPVYVHMKAVRMSSNDNYIIIGVSNIDAQMQAQKHLERMREERISYERIAALTGNYIVIYTVDPVTGDYEEYDATSELDEFSVAKNGENFFERSREKTSGIIYEEDWPLFKEMFTREQVLKEIEENGVFLLNYRLMMDGKPNYVSLKAAQVQEKDGPVLVIGVSNVDAQKRRDMEYERLREK